MDIIMQYFLALSSSYFLSLLQSSLLSAVKNKFSSYLKLVYACGFCRYQNQNMDSARKLKRKILLKQITSIEQTCHIEMLDNNSLHKLFQTGHLKFYYSKNQKICMKFMDFLSLQANQKRLLSLNRENDHFVLYFVWLY